MNIGITFTIHPRITNYFHFIKEYCAQFHSVLSTNNILDKKITVHFTKHPGQYRKFKHIAKLIFPNVDYSMEPLDSYDLELKFGYFNEENDIVNFRNYVLKTLKIDAHEEIDILLIEREEDTRKFKIIEESIRILENHENVEYILKSFCEKRNLKFKNVKLAEISFQEQVSLFRNSKVIIGQHGAGLLNVLWTNPSKTTLIEIEHTFWNVNTRTYIKRQMFKKMSKLLGVNYMTASIIRNNVVRLSDILEKIKLIFK